MIVTMNIPAETHRKIARDKRLAGRAGEALAASMETAVAVGADGVIERLILGELGLKMQNPASGLAASVAGWMTDPSAPAGAIGVRSNSPAAAYARILETGGTIKPKNGKALAIPVSDEAKRYTSPRDMQGLDLIPRKGKPPLLVRKLAARGARRAQWVIHWVLVKSVTIRAYHWLTKGVKAEAPEMRNAFASRLGEYLRKW